MDSIKASFLGAAYEDGYLWVFDNQIQAICRINIDNFNMEIISYYKSEEKFIAQKVFLIQDKIYIASGDSVKVLIYNRKKRENNSVFCLEKSDIFDELEDYVAFMYAEYIFFIPRHIDKKVICFDIYKKKYLFKTFFKYSIERKTGQSGLSNRYFSCYEGTVWAVLSGTKFYVKFDLNKERLDLFQIENAEITLNSCCFDGENVWLTDVNSCNVICANGQYFQISEKQNYSTIYSTNSGIIVFPKSGNKLVFIKKRNFEISILELPLNLRERQNIMVDCCEYNDYIFFSLRYTGGVFLLDKETLKVKRIELKCENYIESCFMLEGTLLDENEWMNLKDILPFCGQNKKQTYKPKKVGDSHGEKIWNSI